MSFGDGSDGVQGVDENVVVGAPSRSNLCTFCGLLNAST